MKKYFWQDSKYLEMGQQSYFCTTNLLSLGLFGVNQNIQFLVNGYLLLALVI